MLLLTNLSNKLMRYYLIFRFGLTIAITYILFIWHVNCLNSAVFVALICSTLEQNKNKMFIMERLI